MVRRTPEITRPLLSCVQEISKKIPDPENDLFEATPKGLFGAGSKGPFCGAPRRRARLGQLRRGCLFEAEKRLLGSLFVVVQKQFFKMLEGSLA